MNPAFRIWSWALATCALAALIMAMYDNGGGAVFVLTFVALASVLSLLGFWCLFALLRQLRLPLPFVWACTLAGVPLIVAVNAYFLLAVFEDGFIHPGHVWRILCELYPVTLIPVTGALAGTLISRRHINALAQQQSNKVQQPSNNFNNHGNTTILLRKKSPPHQRPAHRLPHPAHADPGDAD